MKPEEPTSVNREAQPLVTIATPVYDGEKYLADCIESVLAQTYENWEYIVVNNCSDDNTRQIAQHYAAKDARIRIHDNDRFVGMLANHNIAFRQISSQSKYCKMVEADDWLFPECLMRMVSIAESHPSVGIVGCYGLSGVRVHQDGLPYPSTIVPGRELCHSILLGGPNVFGGTTSLLIRSDLIRPYEAFYNESNIHADTEACYELLQRCDFGFAHQVLIYNRVHEESVSARFSESVHTHLAHNLLVINKFGPIYLSQDEYRHCLAQRLDEYYRFLAKNALLMRDAHFWRYHREGLRRAGSPFSRARLLAMLLREIGDALLHPAITARKLARQLRKAVLRGERRFSYADVNSPM